MDGNSRIDHLTVGPVIPVGTWGLQPTVRLSGRRLGGPAGGAWSLEARVETVEVQGADGSRTVLDLGPEPNSSRGTALGAAAVAIFCSLVILKLRRG